MAPEPAAPPLVLTARTEPAPSAPHEQPFYFELWFWAAVGAVVGAVAVIVLWNIASNGNGPPGTTFGNMHAF
jgi:hypothetical protein